MKKVLFNDNWSFMEGSGNGLFAALAGGAAAPKTVHLPHDAVIGTEQVQDNSLGAVAFYKSRNVCYTKKFTAPEEWAGKCVVIEFEGIYQNAQVYVNNAYAGIARYGYGNHFFDIRRFLKAGEENEIKVVVKNGTGAAGRWYTGGGIYRDVNLYTASPLHIAVTGTRAATESAEEDQAVVKLETPLVYEGFETVTGFITNEILDAEGKVVAAETQPMTFFDHEPRTLYQRLVVPDPVCWDTETPYLYTVRTTVTANGETADTFEDTFGIRTMRLDARKGLRINGKAVKLRGGCIHHDNGVLGAATFGNSEERRVRILKELGYNAIRMSHHPVSKAMLRACDRVGMYIMDEFSDVWCSTKAEFDYGINMADEYENDVAQWVYKDYNHPSVILYSIGNEIPENGNKFDVAFGRKIADIIRSIDPNRYVMNSINIMLAVMDHMGEIMAAMGINPGAGGGEINEMMSSLGDIMGMLNSHPISSKYIEEACGQLDIAGYNYAEDRYEPDAAQYPNRILVGSETFPSKLAKNWALVEKLPTVLGDFVWTAWDYLGESGIGKNSYTDDPAGFNMGKWPMRIAMCGTVDINGVPQPVAYWRQIVWGLRKEPYINVCPPEVFGRKVRLDGNWNWSDGRGTWTWKGDEGKQMDVDVYACADTVELFINGKSQGVKKVGGDFAFMAKFQVAYEPGEIRAVAVKGDEKTEFALRTAGTPDLAVAAENPEIKVLEEVGYVDICLQDENGVVDPTAKAVVTVEVEGGELAGFGSADPESRENFTGNVCSTFRGRALAAVRAAKPGTVTVKVSAEGYGSRTVTLAAKA
jgi:beta-galactosidase